MAQQLIQEEGTADKMIRAFEAGRRIKMQQEQLDNQSEDRKLQKELHKHQIKRLDLEDKLHRRKIAEDAAKGMELLPARNAAEAGYPEPTADQAGPAASEINVPHPKVLLPGIEGAGVPSMQVQPRTLEDVLAQQILQKKQEARAGDVNVPEGMAAELGLPAGRTAPSLLTTGTALAGQRSTAKTAAATSAATNARSTLDRESRERAARIRASAPKDSVTKMTPRQVRTSDGRNVMANYDATTGKYTDVDTGAVLTGVTPPPTADEKNKATGREMVNRGVEAVRDLSKKVIKYKGVAQRAVAAGRSVESVLGHDPEFQVYQDARMATAGNLAVAQQGSRPSDADIKAIWMPMVPDAFRDTDESAQMKWDLIDMMMGTGKDKKKGAEAPATYRYNPKTRKIEAIK